MLVMGHPPAANRRQEDDVSTMVLSIAQATALGALLTAAAVPCRAQQPKTGAVAGIVSDSLGNLLPGVEVTAVKVGRTTHTDTAGHFILVGLPAGTQDLSVRRLSYAPATASVDITVNDTADVEIELGVVAQQLTAVLVQSDAERSHMLDAFEARRKQGIGHFITRSQIENRHPLLLSDMVRLIPGAILVPSDDGRTSLRFARVTRSNCPPQFFVDGMQVYGFSIDDMPPQDVEGVELYAGAAGLPPEFNNMHSTVICGAVIIWTRIPGNDRKKK
jgi:hypothetical protein